VSMLSTISKAAFELVSARNPKHFSFSAGFGTGDVDLSRINYLVPFRVRGLSVVDHLVRSVVVMFTAIALLLRRGMQ
jgi:hypothetical protein